MNARQEMEQGFWDEIAKEADPTPFLYDEGKDNETVEAIEAGLRPGNALEIGCGPGRLTKLIGQNHEVFGCDISMEFVKQARRDDSDTMFRWTTGRMVPWYDEKFDNVYSVTLFQHLDGKGVRAYLNEAERVLKPGGHLRFQFIEGTDDAPMSKHYSWHDMTRWVREAGFNNPLLEPALVYPNWSWMSASKP